MKKWSALLLLGYLFLVGCNTMAGAGRDVERAGEKVQGAAERNR